MIGRNPFLIHTIQDQLSQLQGQDFMSMVLKDSAYKDIHGAIELAYKCMTDNPPMANKILGLKLVADIAEYMEDADDIPPGLFTKH